MRTETEIKQLWDNFKYELKHRNRYFYSNDIINILDSYNNNSNYLNGLNFNENIKYYRARIGNFKDNQNLNLNKDNELLAPPPEVASAGRCNAEGVSYLYLASDAKTAIYEVKPNKGDIVTVGELKFNKTLTIFITELYSKNNIPYADIRNQDNRELIALMKIINDDLKNVVTINERVEYLPYQWFSEYIKSKGFDGFSYSSTLIDDSNLSYGRNFVLFNYANEEIEIVNKDTFIINTVEYNYSKI